MRPRLALHFPTLTAFFALLLATGSPIRAQEPGDIVADDSNAGIMTLAAGEVAYDTLDELIKAKAGSDYYWGEYYNQYAGTTKAETFRFDYLLKDIPDVDGNDAWFYYGCLIGYTSPKNGSVWKWNRFVFSGEVYKLRTGAWAVKRFTITLGLPGYTGTNDYKITYAEGANLFEQYVACLRKAFDLQAVENGDQDAIFNEAGQYDVYINWETHDSDKGGVINLAEWVRGTLINNWVDDVPSWDVDCICGASCSHCCVCGKFDDTECDGTTGTGGCNCHRNNDSDDPPEGCVCAEYCCVCECPCDVHESQLDHSKHKNGDPLCSMEDDETGCSCHGDGEDPETPDDPPEGCVCAEYCCVCECPCDVCQDGSHQPHINGDTTCDGSTKVGYGCSCHGEPDEPEPECTCAAYCCLDKCGCELCAGLTHAVHQNGLRSCDKTNASSGCSCHMEATLPGQPNIEKLTPPERKAFMDNYSFRRKYEELPSAINAKFKINVAATLFNGDLSGDMPRYDFEIGSDMGTVTLDLNEVKEYSEFGLFRAVLACFVYWYFFTLILKDVKRFL